MADDDWVSVSSAEPAAPSPPAAADDGWVSESAQPKPNVDTALGYDLNWSGAAKPLVNQTSVGKIMSAFGEGFGQAWGPEKLGLSDQSVQWLAKKGVFASGKTFDNPFQAFNEGVMVPAATALDAAMRLPGAIYHGAQEAGMAAGLHRDIVSLPDAFMGSPGALGKIETRPGLPKHPETPPLPEGMPENFSVITEAPKQPKDAPFIVAYHGTPHDFERFDLGKIGTGEGAQAYGHGLYFAESEGVAKSYADALSSRAALQFKSLSPEENSALTNVFRANMWETASKDDIRGAAERYLEQTKAQLERSRGELGADWHTEESRGSEKERIATWEKQEAALDKLVKSNDFSFSTPSGNLYNVRINADPEAFLDWDKPLSEQPEIKKKIEDAGIIPNLKDWSQPDENGYITLGDRSGGLGARISPPDKEGWRKVEVSSMGNSSSAGVKGLDAAKAHAEEELRNAGLRGGFGDYINYLARSQKGGPEQAAQAMQRAGIPGIKYLDQGSRDAGEGSRNYVVFNDSDIEITHKNGLPTSLPEDAKDLGVVGPDKSPIADAASPKEAAEAAVPRTMAAEGPKGEKVTQEVAGAPDEWQQRFDHFVGRLEAPDDVKELIRNAAKENGDFQPARQGDIPLSHVDSIAQAAGVDPGEINARGLGRRLQNDGEVRTAMQLMLKVTDDVKAAARDVKAGGDEASLAKLQEAIMRRDLAVEQVVGLRAEWGRTGNVFQEFMTKSREEGGLTDFLKGKGRTPQDLRDIADSLDALDGPQSARFLNDMRTPSAWDKFRYYWVNALISGPITHLKYAIANTAFGLYESAVVTPVAGAIGTARRAITGGNEGVYLGEAAARTWGIVAGVPDAIKASVQAAKTGMQTPLPGEIAQNIIPKQNKNLPFQQRPISGPAGAVIGAPSRGASAIHSFFNFLGYRASIEAQAYRQAAKEGFRPGEPERVKLPAVRIGGDTIFEDLNHGMATDKAETALGRSITMDELESGFTTTKGRFVEREEAARIANVGDDLQSGDLNAHQRQVDMRSGDSFWQRYAHHATNPSADMMNTAIEDGYRLTFINELGENAKAVQQLVNKTKVGQLIMPFVHIPMNILKRAVEGTPAAFFDGDTRAALAGKQGAVKQDMAAARLIAGGSVGAWAVNQVLNDRMTGYGPTDQKERAQWLATGHQPYSIRIGDYWYSFNRFGPLGTMLGLYSNLAEVIPHMKPDSEELTKGIALAVHSTGRLMEDEVGMQGLAGLIEAIEDPERKGTRVVSSFAGSLLPFSSALRQTASAMDPSMREAKTVVDGLRYYIPSVRQGLLPKRDWSGTPIANAGYGGDIAGAPGLSAIIQHRNAIADPVAQELAALDLKPAPPQDRIKGVKLPPKLYDVYQSTAGPYTRTALEAVIRQPGWHDMPAFVRAEVVRSIIRSTRETAATAMQMSHPEIIAQGVKDRIDQINGVKPSKLKDPD